ncbi:demethylmenaquinone methyltransferase/2-methoxy-6-polyprenyl-1,4-benzoquinol methylase [Rhodobium orientis]|uniref:Ubiquinone/menaquinone biosynthesis C-methyltransferase UbiE n=1 Tax=Rhodobium orientis TaxID=34017 RepID=A0A327JPP8_9HYPH|nr:ubiquinone/menaquinone biosynthesis methyltransferase [Rhodobium orientis]MBB4304625.1 demethylmenaquinone methyltransferase/2-methoxy-6-polyprenyl-1,4-benzoquinol methylase [Rhodobium orientis]MBK5950000.1 hypothetical protein [Rhodobium orientis]RAI27695.1 hypothetical protein CH339_09090 [Rhodobium orientis]
MDDLSRTFGRDTVDPEGRRSRIRSVFQDIAPRYDLMNDLMSGGTHRMWKARFADMVKESTAVAAAAERGTAARIVDLAGGTGDIAERIRARLPDADIFVCDPSTAMLSVAQQRPELTGTCIAAEGERLPFADASVDAVTLSFGLRNMTEPEGALAEVNRILVPGGQLFILEFSQPEPWFAPVYRAFSRTVIPTLGAVVTQNRGAYRYLIESIAAFPDPKVVAASLTATGYARVDIKRLFFGVAAIHAATKPQA